MTLWTGIIIASILCLAAKCLGYVLPARLLQNTAVMRVIDLLTVALLAALVSVQTLGAGQALEVDARVPAIAVAAALLVARAPFLVVVVGAALTAALMRAWGWAA